MTDSPKGANTEGNRIRWTWWWHSRGGGKHPGRRQKGYRVRTKNHHVNTHRTQKARYWRKLSGLSTNHFPPPARLQPTMGKGKATCVQ